LINRKWVFNKAIISRILYFSKY